MSNDKSSTPSGYVKTATQFYDFARIGADTSSVTQDAMRLFAAAGSGESMLNTDAQNLKQQAMTLLSSKIFPATNGVKYADLLVAGKNSYSDALVAMFIPANLTDQTGDCTNQSSQIYQAAQTTMDAYINTLNRNAGLDTSTTQVMATAGNAVQPLISGLNSFFN
jgi:hypothetical protein